MDNYDIREMLKKVWFALIETNGPLDIMGRTPEGVEDDIYNALEDIEKRVERRIKELDKEIREAV